MPILFDWNRQAAVVSEIRGSATRLWSHAMSALDMYRLRARGATTASRFVPMEVSTRQSQLICGEVPDGSAHSDWRRCRRDLYRLVLLRRRAPQLSNRKGSVGAWKRGGGFHEWIERPWRSPGHWFDRSRHDRRDQHPAGT